MRVRLLLQCFALLLSALTLHAFGQGGGSISNGGTVSGSLANTTQVDSWTFDLTAGDAIELGISIEDALPSSHDLSYEVYAPDNSDSGYGNIHAYGVKPIRAAQSGTYTLKINRIDGGADPKSAAPYSITYYNATEAINGSDGQVGNRLFNAQTANGSLTRGDIGMFQFYLDKGETAYVTTSEVGPDTGFSMYENIYAPNGTLAGWSQGSLDAVQNFQAFYSGIYTVMVSRTDSNDGAGNYALIMTTQQPFAGTPDGGGGALLPGVENSGSLLRGQVGLWVFNVNQGDPFSVAMTSTAPKDYVEIRNSAGTLRGWTYLRSGIPANLGVKAPETDTYYLTLARDNDADGSNPYTLFLTGTTLETATAGGKDLGEQCDCAADPIMVATGNVYDKTTDYQTAGANPLSFIRYYNSLGNVLGYSSATALGVNWRSTYDRFVNILSPGIVTVERPNGQIIGFSHSGSSYTPDSDMDVSLTSSGASWTFVDTDDTTETYTANPANSAQALLQTITRRNGYTQTLTYANGLLTSVTDSYNRTLSLTYTGNQLNTLTAPSGLVLTYGFETAGNSGKPRLKTVGYSTTPATSKTYLYETANLPFSMTGINDENGNRYASWTYDSKGRGTSNQLAGGAGYAQVAYDDATGQRTVTGPLGIVETHKFKLVAGIQKLTEIDRAASAPVVAATRTLGYDGNGYVNNAVDWNGNITTYANNSHGRPTAIVEAAGKAETRTTAITYDTAWPRLPHVIITPGLTSTLNYDTGTGNLLTRVDADTTSQSVPYSTSGETRTTAMTYTPTGQLHTVRLPRTDVNATTTYSYTGGTLTGTLDALGHATSVSSYTGGGLPQTIVDPNGVTTQLTYDTRQRLKTSAVQTTTGALTTMLDYDPAGNLLSTTLPDGSSLTNTYDNAHRRTVVTDALGNKAAYALDAAGDQTQTTVTDPASTVRHSSAAKFDALGRLLQSTGGAGQITQYGYDSNGNATATTDPLDRLTSRLLDPLNRLFQTIDPAKGLTAQTYDAHDRLLSVMTPNGALTAYTYDGFGDLIQTASPDTGKAVYRYDAAGNLAQKTDARGAITTYTDDALNRLLTKSYPGDPVENVAYSYDQSGHGFGIGRLTGMTDQLGSLGRTYDERGNLLAEARVANGRTIGTAYTYDAASRLSSIAYPSGTKVSYSRDAAGQVSKVATQAGVVASGVTHLPFGPVNGFIFGNGIADARTFDLDYRMTGLADQASGMPKTQALAYGYDLANNVKTITDGVRPYLSQTLGYDMLDRLMSAAATDYGSFAWTYDPNGNRLTESRGPGSLTTGYGYVPGSNRLASLSVGGVTTQTYGYTPTGQSAGVANQGGSILVGAVYNQADRLVASSGYGQIVADYAYDGFGQRLGKLIPGATPTGALFQYGQDGSLLEEADLTAAVKVDYIYLDGVPIGDLAPATHTLAYLHTDHLGTPQLATDASKALVWGAAYYPFGGTSYLAGTITQNLRLPGQYFDAETQVYHNGFRDYAPGFGRYVESDPIGLDGGSNTYAYVEDNPLRWMDPNGTGPWDKTYGLPDQFWSWYHLSGDMAGDKGLNGQVPQSVALEQYQIWVQLGRPCPGQN